MVRSILHLIETKRDGLELSGDEIRELVTGIVHGSVPDYQIGAFLMATYLRGMSDRETADLTLAMVHSGDVIDLSAIAGFKADKHSTGGVGDKVTPVLGPLLAASGVVFPKLSGRGLGHTGGTLDKLESIPGFRVNLSIEEFIAQVNAIGLAVTGQTAELVPADAALYAMRDVTATVDSVPLIASSVMSKKIAAGADCIVLDVKCGSGAFMKTSTEASALARLMVAIGGAAGKRVAALVTDMEEPLGRSVGNAVEVAEAIATLRGEVRGELLDVCLLLGTEVLLMAGASSDTNHARSTLQHALESGAALDKLRAMIEAQGGETAVVDDPGLLPQAERVVPVRAPATGYVTAVNALQIGRMAMELGAGRAVKGAPVDHAVGVVLAVRRGDAVERGETLANIHTNGQIADEVAVAGVLAAFQFGPVLPEQRSHVLEVIRPPTDAVVPTH